MRNRLRPIQFSALTRNQAIMIVLTLIVIVLFWCDRSGGQDRTWPDPVANHVVPMQSTVVT